MKLTSHQKEIVEAIISEKVYDIPSYLYYFKKGRDQQYKPDEIQAIFNECESGRSYLFREDKSYFVTDEYKDAETVIRTLRVPNSFTHDFREYPLSSPVKACIEMKIKPEVVSFRGEDYFFNFLEKSFFVSDNFDDIKDFIALWSYLQREALIIEVSKPIESKDLSIFFELEPQVIRANTSPYWKTCVDTDSSTENDPIPTVDIYLVPQKSAQNYIKNAWKMNYEHLTMCDEFIGKKILPTSSLQIYSQSKYKTFEEVSQHRNLFVAWIAIAVSVIIAIALNILPLLGEQETDYLNNISQQMSAIEAKLDEDNTNQNMLGELAEIKDVLTVISLSLEDMDNKVDDAVITNLAEQVEELNRLLIEQQGLSE